MSSTASDTTARKITRGSKTLVEITFPDGVTVELGGKRAERATAVVVGKLSKLGQGKRDSAWAQFGVRATLASAESEARTILNRQAKCIAAGYTTGHYDEIFAITIN